MLASVLPWPFTFALLKGRNNYVCLHKLSLDDEPSDSLIEEEDLSWLGKHVKRVAEWAQDTETGDRDDLTVVGDANQTIYSFTGATPRFLLDFSRRFPEATVVRLERDYRSTPEVVSLANRVIAAARGRMAGSKLHLVGQRDPGPKPTFAEHPDEVAEADAVVCTSDHLAFGAIMECRRRGWPIPDRIGIAGFGNRRHRAKQLLAETGHLRGNVSEHRRRVVVAGAFDFFRPQQQGRPLF